MASNNTTNIVKPIDSLIEYIKEVKPYHTKFLEIIEKYNFTESMDIQFEETVHTGITIENKALCSPVGFGIEWDEPCGFDPLSCCDLFECIGGYGLIYDNSDVLVSEPIQSIDSTLGTVTVSGDLRFDTKLQITSITDYLNILVKGDYTTEFGTHNLFLIEPLKTYTILGATTDSVTIEGLHATQFTNNNEFKITTDALNSGTYTVVGVNEVAGDTVIDVPVGSLTASVANLGFVESTYICKNQGAYQVDSSSFDGTNTTITVATNNTFDFTDVTDLGQHGSIVLRTGLVSPRRITLIGNDVANDRDYKVLQTTYDSGGDTTTLLLNGTLVGSSSTGTVNLIGYTFGQGFDGLEECSVPKPANIHNNFAEYLDIVITSTETPFATLWETTSDNESIVLPLTNTVVATVDWGDGNVEEITTNNPTHEYATAGQYTVSATGTAGKYGSTSASNQNKCIDILSWGEMDIDSWDNAFDSTSITNVTATDGEGISGTIFSDMFLDSSLVSIDLSNFNTFGATTMSSMFKGCSSLGSLNLSSLDTSNVTTMFGMVENCVSLTTFTPPTSVNSALLFTNYMFSNCISLTNLDISTFNMSQVTNATYMFEDCTNLLSIVMPTSTNTGSLSLNNMFDTCSSLTSIDLSSFDTSSCTSMRRMFQYCTDLVSVDFSSSNTTNVTTMENMFYWCQALSTIDMSTLNTSSVTTMHEMFNGCDALTTASLPTSSNPALLNLSQMFYSCDSLISVDMSSFDTSSVTLMNDMFYTCPDLTSIDMSTLDTSSVTTMYQMFAYCDTLASALLPTSVNTSLDTLEKMFFDCPALITIDMSSFDTSNVQNMAGMFSRGNITALNFASFDTSSVVDMNNMCRDCNMTTVDLSSNDLSNVQDMSLMFYSSSIASVDMSNLTLGQVTDMNNMFYQNSSLTTVDFTNLSTPLLEDVSSMFQNCQFVLTSLDFSSWSTPALLTMDSMFTNCDALTTVDFTNFDTSTVTDMSELFYSAANADVDVSMLDVSSVTTLFRMMGLTSFSDTNCDLALAAWSALTVQSGVPVDFGTAQYCETTAYDDLDITDGWTITSGGPSIFCADSFNTVWKTTTPSESIRLPFSAIGNDLYVDWGDSSGTENVTVQNPTHQYTDAGEYTVRVSGTATHYGDFNNSWQIKCIDVLQWGNGLGITSWLNAFTGSALTTVTATDSFGGSSPWKLEAMFRNCLSLVSIDVSSWDTSSATTLYRMFAGCTALVNLDLSGFDTQIVVAMNNMFEGSTLLSADVSSFDVGELTNCTNIMANSGFSNAHYDAMLLAWSIQTVKPNVSFHAGTAQYTESVARAVLDDGPNNWTFTDGGPV